MVAPEDRVLLAVSNEGRLGLQGLTELFFESAEPNFDDLSAAEFFARFPEGEYEIEGLTLAGQSLESVSGFTHVMPAPPANITISGKEAPAECEEGPRSPSRVRWLFGGTLFKIPIHLLASPIQI